MTQRKFGSPPRTAAAAVGDRRALSVLDPLWGSSYRVNPGFARRFPVALNRFGLSADDGRSAGAFCRFSAALTLHQRRSVASPPPLHRFSAQSFFDIVSIWLDGFLSRELHK